VTPNRDHLFALGIALGTAVGFILGSVIALRVGDEGMDTVRRVVDRILRHDEGPKFELLLQ